MKTPTGGWRQKGDNFPGEVGRGDAGTQRFCATVDCGNSPEKGRDFLLIRQSVRLCKGSHQHHIRVRLEFFYCVSVHRIIEYSPRFVFGFWFFVSSFIFPAEFFSIVFRAQRGAVSHNATQLFDQ